jgi:hypothetical protein
LDSAPERRRRRALPPAVAAGGGGTVAAGSGGTSAGVDGGSATGAADATFRRSGNLAAFGSSHELPPRPSIITPIDPTNVRLPTNLRASRETRGQLWPADRNRCSSFDAPRSPPCYSPNRLTRRLGVAMSRASNACYAREPLGFLSSSQHTPARLSRRAEDESWAPVSPGTFQRCKSSETSTIAAR